MAYDPEEHGCRCEICPLNKGKFIAPEGHPERAEFAVVGTAPNDDDIRLDRAFVGPRGEELERALRTGGARKSDAFQTYVLLCQPPSNDLKRFMESISRHNKKKENASDQIASPIDCCAPRLQAELRNVSKIITLGKEAASAVTGNAASIMAIRGGMQERDATETTAARSILPTISPSYAIKNPRWLHVLRSDVAKAIRWFRGRSTWEEPEFILNPAPHRLRAFLAEHDTLSFDLETDGIEALEAKIRCVGIGNADVAMCVGFLSKDGYTHFYAPDEEEECKQILIDYFADTTKKKIGHNAGYYDYIVLEKQWGVVTEPIIDTILLHKSVESELPHSLGYVASLMTDAPSWKVSREGLKLSSHAETDEELHRYCILDVVITMRVFSSLLAEVKLRQQAHIYKVDRGLQKVCVDMHWTGMYVDQVKRAAVEKQMLARRYTLLKDLRELLDHETFNPASTVQVRELLFEKWRLDPPVEEKLKYTNSGDMSTGDDILRALLTDGTIPEEQRAALKLMRYYRKVLKLLGTYVVKLRPSNITIEDDLAWDEDEDWNDRDTRKRYGIAKRGIVDPYTGRMYPGYNAHVAVCVDPETWLLTNDGLRQIGTIPGYGPAHSERAVAGLKLHDGVAFAEVSHLQNPGVCPTLKVTTSLGIELIGTPHHRVVAAGDPKFLRQTADGAWHRIEPEDAWVRLDQLRPGGVERNSGHYVKVPFGMDTWGSNTALPAFERPAGLTNAVEVYFPSQVDVDLGYFFGVYNADGSIHDANGSFSLRISAVKRREHLAEVEDVAVRLFGRAAVRVGSDGLTVTSVRLRAWAEALQFGRRIENKTLPAWLSTAPKPVVLAYLRGLSLDASCYAQGPTTVWRYTGSKTLAQSTQMLLLNLGVPACLSDRRTEESPLTWELAVRGAEDVERVCAWTGQTPAPPKKAGSTGQIRRKYVVRGNHLWLRVRSVEDTGFRQVYDVTIPTTHQFWANGTVSHNTGRLSSSKPMNCFDGQTELLTDRGWVRFDQLLKEHKAGKKHVAAQWSDKTNTVSFAPVEAYHEHAFAGKMVEYSSRYADLLMTPNHRVPLIDTSGNYVTRTAAELLKRSDVGTLHGSFYRPHDPIALTPAEIQMLGVALRAGVLPTADTCVPIPHGRGRAGWAVSEIKGTPHWLPCAGHVGEVCFADAPRLHALAAEMELGAPLGPWIYRLDAEACDALLATMGHKKPDQAGGVYRWLTKEQADWVQVLRVLSGGKAFLAPGTPTKSVWTVTSSANQYSHTKPVDRNCREVPWEGTVYCVTMPDDSIIVRRNGKVTVTRQSQNFPKKLRSMIVPAPGNVLVGADMDQVELRVAAALWNVDLYLRAFREGKDPHSMTAFAVFGEAFCKAAGIDPSQFNRPGKLVGVSYDATGKYIGKGEATKYRNLSKAVQYASQYMATPETVHALIIKTEVEDEEAGDGTTLLPYALMPMKQVRKMRNDWLKGAAEFQTGWDKEINEYRRLGYLAEPLTGRRRDFLDGENPNELVNFKVQASAAAMMNRAIINLRELIPRDKWGPGTGIINQCHDAIVVECPERFAERVAKQIEDCMNQTYRELPGVIFSASSDIGRSWDKV